jgi:hypothetical protein
MKAFDRSDRRKTRAELRAVEIAKILGWSPGGYADGPNGESKEGWISHSGELWTTDEIMRWFNCQRPVTSYTMQDKLDDISTAHQWRFDRGR